MIFLAAMLWPRPRHPRVGRVLGCEDFDEDVDKDVDEDFDKDVDEDIDEDEDVIEDVDEGADCVNEHEYVKAFRTAVEAKAFQTAAKAKAFQTVAMAKASQSRPSLGCDLSSMTEIVPLFLPKFNLWES